MPQWVSPALPFAVRFVRAIDADAVIKLAMYRTLILYDLYAAPGAVYGTWDAFRFKVSSLLHTNKTERAGGICSGAQTRNGFD